MLEVSKIIKFLNKRSNAAIDFLSMSYGGQNNE
mgnify:CR=1 FL=1